MNSVIQYKPEFKKKWHQHLAPESSDMGKIWQTDPSVKFGLLPVLKTNFYWNTDASIVYILLICMEKISSWDRDHMAHTA